jgi:release factor glutamine methyltransferase
VAPQLMHFSAFPSDNSAAQVRSWLLSQLGPMNGREGAQTADALMRALDDRSRAVLEAMDRRFSEAELNSLAGWLERLGAGEPLQYVLGWTEFCGLRLRCAPGALIPRPETEELVEWALAGLPKERGAGGDVLDIGTGTGCIALAIKAARPDVGVKAWDLSEAALEVVFENVMATKLDVQCKQVDVLDLKAGIESSPADGWAMIVSNPPYIPVSERKEMSAHVTEFEPGEALFVPDDQPLLFYDALVELALATLKPGGLLVLECHEEHTMQVATGLQSKGWSVGVRVDMQGKKRAISAMKPGLY